MPIQIKETEKAVYIKYNRELLDSMGKIRKELETLEKKGVSKNIIFDILTLREINPIEIGFIVKLHGIAKTADAKLIVASQPAVKKTLEFTGVSRLKDIYLYDQHAQVQEITNQPKPAVLDKMLDSLPALK